MNINYNVFFLCPQRAEAWERLKEESSEYMIIKVQSSFFQNIIYLFFVSQAEGRERERLKEESRRTRRLESDYRALLREHHMDGETRWEDFREKVAEDPAFVAVTVEADRERLFKVGR